MARLRAPSGALADGLWRLRRMTSRALRAAGVDGVVAIVSMVMIVVLLASLVLLRHEKSAVQALLGQHPAEAPAVIAAALPPQQPADRLQAFERILPPHDDIPELLDQLFVLAGKEGLLLARGDYRTQADPAGGFLRYRITLPVRGDGAAIQRFVEAALLDQRSLIFESIQIRRERIQSEQVDAVMQWTLVTAIPDVRRARPAAAEDGAS